LPPVNRVYDEYQRDGLDVRLIDIREDRQLVQRTVKERGYTAPVLLDASGDVAGKQYGVWGPPTVVFVDRQGRLIGRAVGARQWDSPQGRAFIKALLEERGPAIGPGPGIGDRGRTDASRGAWTVDGTSPTPTPSPGPRSLIPVPALPQPPTPNPRSSGPRPPFPDP
jgi:hypothetical protein